MTVAEIITDLARTLPIEIFKKYGEPGILSVMNRRYKNLNREYKCLEKSVDVTEVASDALPADWIEPFAMDEDNIDNWTFVNPEIFLADEDYIWTVKNGRIYFGNPDTSNTITFDYFSSGLKLVRTVNLVTSEVASPEWTEESLHSVLYYAVIDEIWGKLNPNYAQNLVELERLKNELHKSHHNRQALQPNLTYSSGKSPKSRYIDDYERPNTILR